VPFSGNIGVRLVDVRTGSAAFQGVTSYDNTLGANVTSYSPTYSTNHYFRALPSLNVNFNVTNDFLLRAGVAEVMSRPPLDELRASTNLSYYPPAYLQGSAGNPQLHPFMATQADLSAEWYFHKDALVALAGYYKSVSTNIGYAQTPQTIGGTVYTITGPQNGPGGHILGTEATFQTPFYFVPAVHNFGVYANIALVTSNLKELAPIGNPFAAVGLAAFTSETDLWYSGHGIDARVGLKHHSPYTAIFGWNAAQLTRLEAETTLGVSVSYAITKSVTVRAQANNLTNQASRYYFNNDPNQIARYEKYGANYLLDVTFKY
jgi:TonB-dependent receptor